MSYDFYFSQEWALKHNKSLWRDKNYNEEDDMAIKELFDQLDEDHSNTIEYSELLKMMKNLNIHPDSSRLPKYFGFVGEHAKNSLSFEEFKGLVSSNKCIRLYGDIESENNINELIEFLKMSLSNTDNSQKSVDIYKELFGLPVYYTGMYGENDSKNSKGMNVWQKMKRAMRELHTVNEKVNKSKEKGRFQFSHRRRRRSSRMNSGNGFNFGDKDNKRRISVYDINSEKERINQLVMTLPSINNEKKNKEKEKDSIEKPETPINDYCNNYTPIPPINPSPLSRRNNVLRKKRSVIIKPMTSQRRRASQFYEINEEGEVLPIYSPVKCV